MVLEVMVQLILSGCFPVFFMQMVSFCVFGVPGWNSGRSRLVRGVPFASVSWISP